MDKQVGKALLTKYLKGTADEQEKSLVEQWYAGMSLDKMREAKGEDYERIKSEIWDAISVTDTPKSLYRYAWVKVAATIVVLLTFTAVYYALNYSAPDNFQLATGDSTTMIKPGGIGATLTLSDGKQIKLTAASDGELAKESGISISKSEDGFVVYEVKGETAHESSESTHILTTTKGETYMIVLPDKSKVWLNASSRLTFSTQHRKVKLEGEGYFEISKDKRPFTVETKNQTVQVLGTHFNINAYSDEDQIKTSLLEGRVRIITAKGTRELSPGQQAVNTGGKLTVQEVDLEAMVAWKNGYFKFNGSLETVMRTIARWYDLELDFEPNAPKEITLWGYVSRSNELDMVLRQLERTNKVTFVIQGRKIVVRRAN